MRSSNSRFAPIVLPIVVLFFLREMVFLGKIPLASDTIAHKPISKWAREYVAREGNMPQWFPYLFSGMPSYGGQVYLGGDPVHNLLKPIFINRGVRYWFHLSLGGLGMFFFLRRRRLGWIPSLFGAFVFSMTPYFSGLINAGHSSKLVAMSYIPFLFLAFDYVLERPRWRYVFYLSLVAAIQLWSKHPQIVYYTWMLLIFLWGWRQVRTLKKKRWSIGREGTQTGIVIATIVLATVLVSDPYLATFQFQEHSTRGGASVLDRSGETQTGTRWDYATNWSFHPKETISFVYPYFYGLQNYSTRDLKSVAYWGYMPFTQSTHYLGLMTILIMVVGLVIRKPDNSSVSMLVASGIILIIGFGKYFPILYWPLFKFAPLYSKFRVPSMIYLLLAFTIGTLSAIGLENILSALRSDNRESARKMRKTVLWVFGIVVGVSVLFLSMGDALTNTLGFFVKAGDSQRFQPQILAQLKSVRHDIFQQGVLLALAVSAAGFSALWVGIKKMVTPTAVGIFILVISVVDLWIVGSEFLQLKPAGSIERQFRPTPEVKFMTQDKGLFRILPLDELNANWYAYFGLATVGGYRPVKLRTYQDLMDGGGFNSLSVLNMLNVRYVLTKRELQIPNFELVFSGKQRVYENLNVLPRAWFVRQVVSVKDQQESLRQVLRRDFDPRRVAIIANYDGPELTADDSGSAIVSKYGENEIILRTNSSTGGLMVLSENYYGPGWNAFVDGKEVEIYQTNYVLRSVYVPVGEHTVTFKYDDSLYRISRLVSRISLSIVLLSIVYFHRKALKGLLTSSLGKGSD